MILLPKNSTLKVMLTFVFSYLYQIAHLGDDDDEPEFSSAMPLEEGDTFFFAPRQLRNLVLVDELVSMLLSFFLLSQSLTQNQLELWSLELFRAILTFTCKFRPKPQILEHAVKD